MNEYTLYASPIGSIAIYADADHLIRLDFLPAAEDHVRNDAHPVLLRVCRWLDDYFSGSQPDPAVLPVRLEGSDFQLAVWNILRNIPYGQSLTYGEIARRLSPKMSAQAVGGAVGKNPISIILPCHRVLGAGGRLTGYAWGLERKCALLDLEQIPYCK